MEENKDTKKVVSNTVKVKKKGKFKKFINKYVCAGDAQDVASYMIFDVLIPTAKQTILDCLKTVFFGNSRGRESGNRGSYQNHNVYVTQPRGARVDDSYRTQIELDDIFFQTKGDAEAVLVAMDDILSQYNFVSIADMYELSDVPDDNYTNQSWGWTNLSRASILHSADGYFIEFPKPVELRRIK